MKITVTKLSTKFVADDIHPPFILKESTGFALKWKYIYHEIQLLTTATGKSNNLYDAFSFLQIG